MKIDRLIGIITVLLQNEKTTAPFLAKKFEVSRRTILRDINTLCLAGIPVVTSQGGDGGISVMSGYKLDKSLLTTDELQSIITGIKSIGSITQTSNLERLLQKLTPDTVSLADSVIIDLSSYHKDSLSEKIAVIKKAVAENRLISFDYYYGKGLSQRKIEPYFIAFKWSAWYVFGWCAEREDFRLFKLNRLWELKTTDDVFAPRAIPPDKAELGSSLNDPYGAVIRFDKSVRFRLIEEYGLNCFTETEDAIILDHHYTNKDFMLSWILGFGDKTEIISPPELREEIAAIAKNIAEKYKRR